MKTVFILMAQYDGKAVIPLDDVVRDYFPHLSRDEFVRKQRKGQIPLPIVSIEPSQKAARGVHITDLSAYIDKQRAVAAKDAAALQS